MPANRKAILMKRRRLAKQCHSIRPAKRQVDNIYWSDELEKQLNRFGVTTCDLPELNRESCTTDKQYQHAVRIRARYLLRRIREIEQVTKGDDVDRLFADVMDRAALIDDGPAWFEIEKGAQKSRSSAPEENCAC